MYGAAALVSTRGSILLRVQRRVLDRPPPGRSPPAARLRNVRRRARPAAAENMQRDDASLRSCQDTGNYAGLNWCTRWDLMETW